MEWPSPDIRTIIIDNGTTNIRAGFASDPAPITVLPTAVGRPKHLNTDPTLTLKSSYVGHDAISKRGLLVVRNPIERGIITNWEDMEAVWRHTFEELKADSKEQPLLLSEVGLNPQEQQRKMTQIMFETFEVPYLYISPAPVLALYGYGRIHGVVLSSGGGITQAVPIYGLHPIQHGITQLEIGGNDITNRLMKLIGETNNMELSTQWEKDKINKLKTKSTYVALDYQHELQNMSQDTQSYDKLDKPITLGKERFQAPEILFDPKLFGLDACGVHQMIVDSVMKSDETIRKLLFEHICLAGGNVAIPGFTERLKKELDSIVPKQFSPHVNYSGEPLNTAWLGASRLGSASIFLDTCMTKEQYDEAGPWLVTKFHF